MNKFAFLRFSFCWNYLHYSPSEKRAAVTTTGFKRNERGIKKIGRCSGEVRGCIHKADKAYEVVNGLSSAISYHLFEASNGHPSGKEQTDSGELAKRKTEKINEIMTNLEHFGTY